MVEEVVEVTEARTPQVIKKGKPGLHQLVDLLDLADVYAARCYLEFLLYGREKPQKPRALAYRMEDPDNPGAFRVVSEHELDPTDPQRTYLSREELAKRCGVGMTTVWKWQKEGLPSVRWGEKSVRFRVADVEAWLAKRARIKAVESPPPTPRPRSQVNSGGFTNGEGDGGTAP